MPEPRIHTRLAAVYAQGLFEAATAAGAGEAIRADVESLRELLGRYPAFAHVLGDPRIDAQEREKIIRNVLEGRVHPFTLNFLLVLNRRYRLGQLESILAEYVDLDNRQRLGRRDVEVVAAVVLDDRLLEQIKGSIQAWGGFEPVLRVKQDESLLGGLIIRVGDRQIDASVRGHLERLRERIKATLSAAATGSSRQRAQT